MPILAPDEAVGKFHTVRATTGILGATLAAGASVFAMRNAAASTRSAYITSITGMFADIVAFTTGSQQLFVVERFTTATPSGGQAYVGFEHDSAHSATVFTDIRAATTGALTVTSVQFEGNQIPLLSMGSPVVSAVHNAPTLDFSDNPLRIRPGEGLCIRNVIVWPAAGTGILHSAVTWYE